MQTVEEIRYTGICKCCLENVNLKNLWSEYYIDGETEIYGHMIAECFVLPWNEPEDPENSEQICDECISRLRSAYNFKKQVLQSEQELTQHFSNDELLANSYIIKYVIEEEADETKGVETSNYQNEIPQEVEFVENEDQHNMQEKNTVTEANDQNSNQNQRKLPRKKRKDVLTRYKNYTQDDLQNALEAVNNQKMNRAKAAVFYNIPRKTLDSHLRKQLNEPRDTQCSDKIQLKFIEEVKQILIYTNATPFRSGATCYYCIYCQHETVNFLDAEELRVHTKVQHSGERTNAVKNFLKPNFRNRMLRMDIKNLICTICCTMIADWKAMLQHLEQIHNVELIEVKNRVIPYILKSYNLNETLNCAICKDSLMTYKNLDIHMNSHYQSYVCADCGMCFITKDRLKKHVQTHMVDKQICNICGKVFKGKLRLSKHYNFVHKGGLKIQCLYCSDKFKKVYDRHLHLLENHKEKITYFNCEQCGKVFTYRPYYVNHLNKQHNKVRKHKCQHCEKMFYNSNAKKKHEETHSSQKKNVCELCRKSYCTPDYLKRHYANVHSVTLIWAPES